ncbi:MAG: OmpA family protein [Saprospiraceae bacterium]|nr:OmpA family protein [Saprospiraceae bacterium]
MPLALLAVGGFIFLRGFNTDVSMEKQQNAFYVDADGNLLDKSGELVKGAGEFQLVDGYYVDNSGVRIQRKIDETKEKLNVASDKTKEALDNAADKTKQAVDNAVDQTKEAVSNAATVTTEAAKETFDKLFNTKAVGTAYALSQITFDPNSHRITNMSKEEVEGLAAALKEHPESRIQVQVHTADGKNAADSKKISDLRAEVVKNMLVTLGVDAKQISSKGLSTKEAAKAAANTVEVVVEQ